MAAMASWLVATAVVPSTGAPWVPPSRQPRERRARMNKSLWMLCGIAMIDYMGFGIVLPLLPFYAQSMGASSAASWWPLRLNGVVPRLWAGPYAVVGGSLPDRRRRGWGHLCRRPSR